MIIHTTGRQRRGTQQWGTLSAEQRGAALGAAANEQLTAAGVPVCKLDVNNLPEAVKGRFDWEPWLIELSKPFFSKPILQDADGANVASIVYHEARHAEQPFNIARLLAGKGKSDADILAATKIHPDVIKAARQRKIDANDPNAAAAEKNFASIFGKNSAAREDLLEKLKVATEALAKATAEHDQIFKSGADVPTRKAANEMLTKAQRAEKQLESQYKALPEEADAFAVQHEVASLFLFPNG